jgi:hypothetical protein
VKPSRPKESTYVSCRMSAAFAGAVPSGLHVAATLGSERTRACQILEHGDNFMIQEASGKLCGEPRKEGYYSETDRVTDYLACVGG